MCKSKILSLLLIFTLLFSMFIFLQSSPVSAEDQNVTAEGTTYIWSKNILETSDANKVEVAINDTPAGTSVDLNGGVEDAVNAYEAAGVIWPVLKDNITAVEFTNGIYSNNNGVFTANLTVQTTVDGTTWTNTDWTSSLAYPYNSSAASNANFRFTGTPLSGILGIRICGQVNTTGSPVSKIAYLSRFYAYQFAETTPTPTPEPVYTNVALGKIPLLSSLASHVSYITDGDFSKTANFTNYQFTGVQWLQIDLAQNCAVDTIKLWHYYGDGRSYHDVIVQLSNDPCFNSDVTTVFNNDSDNSVGLGAGTDLEYAESDLGKTLNFNIINARYVRFYTNGSNVNEYNHCVEAQVFGTVATPPVYISKAIFTKISCSAEAAVSLKGDGTVWSWGGNGDGQLGDGTTNRRANPMQIAGLSDVEDVAIGFSFCLALKKDGSVWSWGNNSSGQLGDGTTTQHTTPVKISSLENVKSIAVNGDHSMALKSDGTLWAWGNNSEGQIGDNTKVNKSIPVQINVSGVISEIVCGRWHSLAVTSDGSLWAWGCNSGGQLGNGSNTSSIIPTQITSITNVKHVAASDNHTLALKNDGTIYSWGYNFFGSLGDTTNTTRNAPAKVNVIGKFVNVACSQYGSMAIKDDGTLYAWGFGECGQLGDGTYNNSNVPVLVKNIDGITQVSGGYNFIIAVGTEGKVWSWGNNRNGQLGYTIPTYKTVPVKIMVNAAGIQTGRSSRDFFMRSANAGYEWGNADYFQSGDGSMVSKCIPVEILNGSSFNMVTGSFYNSAYVDSAGSLYMVGSNGAGQFGNGTSNTYAYTPLLISGIANIKSMSEGTAHMAVIKNDDSLWVSGLNGYGQLGLGTNTNVNTFTQLSGLGTVKAVACEDYSTIVLKSDGSVWSFGANSMGELGDGTNTNKNIPVQVSGLTSGVSTIAAGSDFAVAIKTDGTVWAWGHNKLGDLGNGSTDNSYVPVQVNNLSAIKSVTCGSHFAIATANDGSLWSWGANESGQLGNGIVSAVATTNPVNVTVISGVSQLACAGSAVIALKNDNSVWTWGSNKYGELGIGSAGEVALFPSPLNIEPTISSAFPNESAPVYADNSYINPSVTVSDLSNDILTAMYYLDDEIAPRQLVSTSNTYNETSISFNPLNSNSLSEGTHIIRFEVTDGVTNLATKSAEFIVDRSAPIINSTNIFPTERMITVNVNATDAVSGLDPFAFRYTLNNVATDWLNKDSYTNEPDTLYSPNTQYNVQVEVKDAAGNICTYTGQVYTEAEIPALILNWSNKDYVRINLNNNNPVTTQYQFICGTSYINASGNLTDASCWITPQYDTTTGQYYIDAFGLSPASNLTFKAKAKNDAGVETEFSPVYGLQNTNTLGIPVADTIYSGYSSILLRWKPVADATGYYVYNTRTGVTTLVTSGLCYSDTGLSSNQSYTYKIKAKNRTGDGTWTGNITATTLKTRNGAQIANSTATYNVSCTNGEEFTVELKVNNMFDFTPVFTVTYNSNELDVVDLSSLTPIIDLSTGDIADTDLTMTSVSPGIIVFKTNKSIPACSSFTGVVNLITFKSKTANSTVSITFSVN